MLRNAIKILSCIITFYSVQATAQETININVRTNEQTAAAIGYTVEGRSLGNIGKSYSGKGPTNTKYVFGYRKHSIRGANIFCGEHTLTKDTNVILVIKGDDCHSVITQ